MKSYKQTLFTLLVLALIGTGTYLSFNAYNFSSNTVIDEPKYSEVRVFATNASDFERMKNVDLIIDHANRKPGHYLDAWLSEYEIGLLQKSGVPYQILVEDWMEYFNSQPKMTQSEIDAQMQEVYEKDNITHSIYGSMGGYLTFTEVVAKLDSMRQEYPQFISQKFSIGTTYENRTIWAVRVTKNPDAPTGKPEVLYHALIHAREPESMETQVYYMYWLFENYNTDPIARYILNNREIYWVPVYNADGYVWNQTTNPNGGGMWRANRHFTSGNCGPVDPNRNYGIYQFWNSPNGGSSTNECSGGSGTYRGTSPFSELETQAMRNFVNSRNIKTCFGAHTYGNLLIKPWAWSDPNVTPDDNMFNQFLADMSATNGYTTGTPSQTVGYYVRGGSDDWYYNDSGHSKIFGITPETGTSFWPPQSQIIPLAQVMLFSNQYMSLIAGPYVNPISRTFNQQTYNPGQSGTYRVVFRNKGVMAASNVKVIWTPGSSNVTIPTQQFNYATLASFATDSSIFNFTISNSAPNNCGIPTTLTIKLDTTTIYTANVYILVGTGIVVLNDNGSTFNNWTATGPWDITTSQFNSPPSSFTDSPTGNYGNNINVSMTLTNPINVSANPVVYLSFFHKYTTEAGYDFCYVEVSSNNGSNWSTVAQYDGTLSTWTEQVFDITQYANGSTQMKIRFRLQTDPSLTFDGWYVDDIKVTNYCGTLVGISGNSQLPGTFALAQNFPNPFNPGTVIKYQLPKESLVKITIYDVLGKNVATLINEKKNAGYHQVEFNASGLASGLYLYKIEAGSFTDVKKMMLIK
ncbi:MAG: T9SS type A sorting domain-containing protein [Chlorobi bacterium]|nr:T9SS type A sorting domain-containing protein [Chlorobiota bacterium]MCI0716844.1 T9SS type A sorting domain-containing protein [Chlorobiota bacterium]